MARAGKTRAEIIAATIRRLETEMAAWDGNVIGAAGRPKPEPVEVKINGREFTMIPDGDVQIPDDGGMPTLSYRAAKVSVILNTVTLAPEKRGLLPPALMDRRAAWGGYADDGPPVGRGTEWKGYGE